MEQDDRIATILKEILDVQRTHLEEYRRVTSESLKVQREAFESQSSHMMMYRRVALLGGILIAALLALILWLTLSVL